MDCDEQLLLINSFSMETSLNTALKCVYHEVICGGKHNEKESIQKESIF